MSDALHGRHGRGRLAMWAILLFLNSTVATFAQDDDDELPAGLDAEYRAGDVIIRRIDGDLAFNWQDGSPDLRLPPGPFRARWTGKILLRSEGTYRWHAYVQGHLSVRIGESVVLDGDAPSPQWLSGENVELPFGEFPVQVDYESSGAGRLLLCWSSDQFPLEPVPYHALFHERSDVRSGLFPSAAMAILEFRCDRCHGEVAGLTSSPAPALTHIAQETSREWLIGQIHHGGGNHGHMPDFGFTRSEAEAILAALSADATSVDVPPNLVPVPPAPKDVELGRELLLSIGCLACHEWKGQGWSGAFGGPTLTDVAQRRSTRWLDVWLRDPAAWNPQHRMPVFSLSDEERRQIVSALVAGADYESATDVRKTAQPAEIVRLGRALIREARCAACHELPGSKEDPPTAPRWAELNLNGEGCWSKDFAGERRPARYGRVDVDDVRRFLDAVVCRQISPSADLHGAQLLLEKGCLNCHDRDGRKGISTLAATLARETPNLQGRAPWLIPPQLTAVGDRLPDERLAKAISGELPTRRLDWLLVRMPRYRHTDSEQTALLTHLIGHDRIPSNAPATPDYPQSDEDEATSAGRELIGGKGFSCVACHPVKDFSPKNVAHGTRGSNLFRIGERLRPEYFFRWTRSPLRVVPGVEMPSYQRPHADIFPGDLNRQLSAIWTALNDPNLPTPVNPGAVEQYWTVGPRDAPRILRDVVTLPGTKDVTVPRAFAVGFPNGHSLLFDLDTAALRAWTVGDFAQQRTQGKSWFWDLVGTPALVNGEGASDFLVLTTDTKTVLYPSEGAQVRLLSSQVHGPQEGVSVSYELRYRLPKNIKGPPSRIVIQEQWRPAEAGWTRNVAADCNSDGRDGLIGEERVDLFLLEPVGSLPSAGVKMVANWRPVVSPIDRRKGYRVAHDPHGQKNDDRAFRYTCETRVVNAPPPPLNATLNQAEDVNVVPGFTGRRLPYPKSVMPTAMTFDRHGNLLFTSLKGHVYRADDRNAQIFAEGLAAPFGVLDSHDMVIVAHKPEIVGLLDTDDDGRADQATVIASGWGYTDDYHDWTCGLVRDAEGNLFTTLGSDYAHKNRPLEKSLFRGHAVKIDPSGGVSSLARGLRFPTGVAMTSQQHIFITDQQGVQNTFNELNWIPAGWWRQEAAGSEDPRRAKGELRFGVPSLHEPDKNAPATDAAVQIPHPWTRSVNGICAIPKTLADRTHVRLLDQILGCEYDNRFLVRFSWQIVDGVMQGAAYPFGKPSPPGDPGGLLGPLSIAVSPEGDVYVGSVHDSGWQGGLNVGDVVKFSPAGRLPNGLCEIRATRSGFDLEFFHPVDRGRAEDPERYHISGYTRVWQGAYATPDTGRHDVVVESARLNADGTVVSLTLAGLKPGHVYDVSVGPIGGDQDRSLWPNVGFYTLHRLPGGP